MRLMMLIVFVLLTMVSCTKKDPLGKDEYVSLSYLQTQCSDPWKSGANDSATLQNLKLYLGQQRLYVASLAIKTISSGVVCTACVCKTGKTIFVSTLNSSGIINEYKKLGFVVVK